ncbi:hypothetical protein EDF35_2020 [Rathayibacter sp. PhB151]|uniref:hypothetical protein n=1 Tax=Rathayibacter sp. PhB151 TaxID=2485189 RepID=UPI00106438DD|nr:hypothetical protein [Rathayibacter sp. PhB151]TDX78800.1 hypothetical protein EDF35_2020 [Rathayibacter sp. PhB151]
MPPAEEHASLDQIATEIGRMLIAFSGLETAALSTLVVFLRDSDQDIVRITLARMRFGEVVNKLRSISKLPSVIARHDATAGALTAWANRTESVRVRRNSLTHLILAQGPDGEYSNLGDLLDPDLAVLSPAEIRPLIEDMNDLIREINRISSLLLGRMAHPSEEVAGTSMYPMFKKRGDAVPGA